MNLNLLLHILAFICFVLAVFNVAPFGLAPIALGLALWVLAHIVPARGTG